MYIFTLLSKIQTVFIFTEIQFLDNFDAQISTKLRIGQPWNYAFYNLTKFKILIMLSYFDWIINLTSKLAKIRNTILKALPTYRAKYILLDLLMLHLYKISLKLLKNMIFVMIFLIFIFRCFLTGSTDPSGTNCQTTR